MTDGFTLPTSVDEMLGFVRDVAADPLAIPRIRVVKHLAACGADPYCDGCGPQGGDVFEAIANTFPGRTA